MENKSITFIIPILLCLIYYKYNYPWISLIDSTKLVDIILEMV